MITIHKRIEKRCSVSGKPINNHEVIISDFAIQYVEKQGFTVTPAQGGNQNV